MSTYASKDACTDLILDFISEHESGGNYNAVIGNPHATDDLGKLTLGGIYDLMSTLLGQGQPSSAVGRYQIIRKTLQSLQGKLGLPNSALFTPALQDRLAVELMIGRGYSRWWRGEISDPDFAHELSCEWASLPDPQADGKSHYDGVGPNHAGATLDQVYDLLKRARAAMAPIAVSAPAQPIPAQAAGDPDNSADALNAAELANVTGKQNAPADPITVAAASADTSPPDPPPATPVPQAAPVTISGAQGGMIATGGIGAGATALMYLTHWPLQPMTEGTATGFATLAALAIGALIHSRRKGAAQ